MTVHQSGEWSVTPHRLPCHFTAPRYGFCELTCSCESGQRARVRRLLGTGTDSVGGSLEQGASCPAGSAPGTLGVPALS